MQNMYKMGEEKAVAERITSRSNPLIKHLRLLASSGTYRRQQGQFLCDSPKLLEEALRWEAGVETVVYTAGAPLPPLPASVRAVEVTEDVMAAASPAKTPQGVLCVCALPQPALPPPLDGRRYVALDGVQDPGNVGTVLRTADAFECDGLLLLPGCADPYGPKAVRASMGAVFRRRVWTCGVAELEGNVGGNLAYSSRVDAACDWSGPVDLNYMSCGAAEDTWNHAPEEAVMGFPFQGNEIRFKVLDATSYIDPFDPPVILFHGTADPVVPCCQAPHFYGLLQDAGVESELHLVEGGGHGMNMYSAETLGAMTAFLDRIHHAGRP